MKIGLASPSLVTANLHANLDAMESSIQRSEATADLWIFPECNLSGGALSYEEARGFSAANPFAQIVEFALRIAADFGTAVCCGCPDLEEEKIYISHMICTPNGTIAKQRKLCASNPLKPPTFFSGSSLQPIEIAGVRSVILACSDSMFPEIAILAYLLEPDLILCPTDAYEATETKLSMLTTILKAKAWDCGAHVISVFGNLPTEREDLIASIGYTSYGKEVACDVMRPGIPYVKVVDIDLTQKRPAPWGKGSVRARLLYEGLNQFLHSGTDAITEIERREA